MPSTKLLKIAKQIAVKDKAVFDTLMEFEKTGKIRTKTRVNFTIDKGLASRFRKLCRNKGYNMSARVEKIVKSIVESGR